LARLADIAIGLIADIANLAFSGFSLKDSPLREATAEKEEKNAKNFFEEITRILVNLLFHLPKKDY